jgi:hypothetical protein
MFSVMVFTVVLGSSFEQWTFPFLRVPELSLSSANSSSLLTASTLKWLFLCQVKSHCDWRSVSQSVSLLVPSPIWGSWPDIYNFLTVMVLCFCGALSDERMGLSFAYTAGPCQRSLFLVRILLDSWPYFTVSDLRLPPTTRRVAVEVFDPASTRVNSQFYGSWNLYIALARTAQKTLLSTVPPLFYGHVAYWWLWYCCLLTKCLQRFSLAMGVFAELFPINCYLCCLHNSSF